MVKKVWSSSLLSWEDAGKAQSYVPLSRPESSLGSDVSNPVLISQWRASVIEPTIGESLFLQCPVKSISPWGYMEQMDAHALDTGQQQLRR